MVRLINKNNMEQVSNIAYSLMHAQEMFTYVAQYNYPDISPCVYAMWHGNQFCIYGIPNNDKINILISNSIDGEIISRICQKMGFGVCRGSSQRKGAVSGTLQMLSKLKDGENLAIMVDGPRGPLHTVKSGAVVVAREANVPIVPVTWYSPNFTFLKFPSWDRMTTPLGPCWLLNLYGDPIYTDGKTNEQVVEEVRNSLLNLDEIAPQKYKEAVRQGLWFKNKKK